MTLKGLEMSKKSGRDRKRGKTRAARRASHQVTSEAALDFIRKMQKAFPKAPRTNKEKERLRKYLAQFRDGLLKAVGRRVQSDLMLRPPQTIRRGDFEKPRPSGRSSSRQA
jgi:hypothetical protein